MIHLSTRGNGGGRLECTRHEAVKLCKRGQDRLARMSPSSVTSRAIFLNNMECWRALRVRMLLRISDGILCIEIWDT